MMIRVNIMLIFLANTLNLQLAAQDAFLEVPASTDVRFERFEPEEGFPLIRALTLAQDEHGFIWAGGLDGLFRYDGYEFLQVPKEMANPRGLSAHNIKHLYVDRSNNLWIGSTDNGARRLDRDNGGFIQYNYERDDPGALSGKQAGPFLEDELGNLWVGSSNGLHVLDRRRDTFQVYYPSVPGQTDTPLSILVTDIEEAGDGKLWVGAYGKGLFRFDPVTTEFEQVVLPWPNTPDGNIILYKDRQGVLWIGTSVGLFQSDPDTGRIRKYLHPGGDPPASEIDRVNDILEDRQGSLWIGTDNGLYCLDRTAGRFDHFQHDPEDPHSLSNDLVTVLLEDRQGDLWVGTARGGLNRLVSVKKNFQFYDKAQQTPGNQIPGRLYGLAGDARGRIWTSDQNGRLFSFDPVRKAFASVSLSFPVPPSSGPVLVSALHANQQGTLWIGTVRHGVFSYDPERRTLAALPVELRTADTESNKEIGGIYEDRQGRLWLATLGAGLYRIDLSNGTSATYTLYPAESNRPVRDLYYLLEDRRGDLWVVTNGNGLFRLDPDTGANQHYHKEDNRERALSSNRIYAIFEDQQGMIWLGADYGLDGLDPVTGHIQHIRAREGLVDGKVFAIQQDDYGIYWIATDRGIFRFDANENSFQSYGYADDLPVITYAPNAVFKDAVSGQLFFAGEQGLLSFRPGAFYRNEYEPPIVLSKYTCYRQGRTEPVQDLWIEDKTSIQAPHNVNILEFQFAALNFQNPEKNQYAYRLKGFSDEWVSLGTEPKIRFTNLRPGRYTLELRGSNNDGIWNEEIRSLRIRILAPWWWNPVARTIYLLLGILVTWGLYRYQLEKRLVEREAEQLKALDQVKSRFFTNISHEFRTPLTVIRGMSDLAGTDDKAPGLIKRNADHLLGLVNQLLDLSKIEANALQLELIQDDVLRFLRYLVESFYPLAARKSIHFSFLAEQDRQLMDFDPEKLRQVVTNLLANALKFTPEKGAVYLQVDVEPTESGGGSDLVLKVRDTGVGIPEDQIPHIFDRFYQVDWGSYPEGDGTGKYPSIHGGGGTGIGLALVKELVKLMGGHIAVVSRPGRGAIFTVRLPIRQEAPLTNFTQEQLLEQPGIRPELLGSENSEQTLTGRAGAAMQVLIVEDNPDVVHFLTASIGSKYAVRVATNGQEGLRMAFEFVPDLIISDVMMPLMDGFELCDTLKNDRRTSHIPVVLLTARADSESRIAGLRRGADAYLAKPFDREELLVRLEALIAGQERIRQRYLSEEPRPEPAAELELEDQFVRQFRKIVEAELQNEELDVTFLVRALGLSRTQLHRKIKALTGRSTTGFIKVIRLQKAKELLADSNLNITEVAYQVGFRNPGSFSRAFREEFGMAPKEWMD